MKAITLIAVTIAIPGLAVAQTQVPHTFQSGQPARAAEVNANFDALESGIDQNITAISQIPAGPEGPPGPQGDPGPQGLQGPEGPAGTVEPGSIGLAEIDPTQVQVRVGGSCAVGSFVAAIADDGSVTCGTGSSDDGRENSRYGFDALFSNTTGSNNTAHGHLALYSNTTGGGNVAHGYKALYNNTTGARNTAQGLFALYSNTTGDTNTAQGVDTLRDNTTGWLNAAYGNAALRYNTIGVENTALGHIALYNNTTGSSNIALGSHAGQNFTTGDFNIAIGNWGVAGEANTTRIGTSGQQNRTFVSGIRGVATGIGDAVSVVIDSQGQLGTVSSSGRYKQDIADMGQASDRLLQLRPVTFRYKKAYQNGERPLEYGLIAEEVAEVFPELVVYDEDNQPESVKYRLLSTLLLNELQKQDQQLASLSGQVAEMNELIQRMAQLNGLLTDESVAVRSVE